MTRPCHRMMGLSEDELTVNVINIVKASAPAKTYELFSVFALYTHHHTNH